jgi:prepilin-type N-terminal cleavage/methylation domain-containing protein
MRENQHGFSLVEMMVTALLMGGLGIAAFNIFDYNRRETARLTEDIQATISKYGGGKVLNLDLMAAEPTFNFLNVRDDAGRPFFVLAPNELCVANCDRTVTLRAPAGGSGTSKSMFFVVRRGYKDEMQKFSVNPEKTFSGGPAFAYAGINRDHADKSASSLSISKSNIGPTSPWEQNRVLLLTSEMSFYDCRNSVLGGDACNITCTPPGKCDFVGKRPLRFLGRVNDNESDLGEVTVRGQPNLLLRDYKICRPDSSMRCSSHIDIGLIRSAETFMKKLPYLPGMDNRAYLSPVDVIEYQLKRPTFSSPDHQTQLIRTRYKLVGNELVPDVSTAIVTGVAEIIFKRRNVSNPLIEYRIRKVSMRKSVK